MDNIKLYNYYFENIWYINYLDYEYINYINKKKNNNKNKMIKLQERLDLFELPMIFISGMN